MTDEEVLQVLSDIQRAEKELLELYRKQISVVGPLTYQHFYLFGIARRALSQSNAFRSMIESRNSLVALALVRLQMDTMLRLYALFFVTDPDDFATKVYHGASVNKLKDDRGQLMSDTCLRDRVASQNAWVPDVYRETSGYIHFSHRHIQAALSLQDKGAGKVELRLGPHDIDKPLAYYGEAVRAFRHITMMIPIAAGDWFERLKSNPGKPIGESQGNAEIVSSQMS